MTRSGVACQRWDSQSPNAHGFSTAYFPDESISDSSNFCRNKDLIYEVTEPWCFTMGTERWEYCDIPKCSGKSEVYDGSKIIMFASKYFVILLNEASVYSSISIYVSHFVIKRINNICIHFIII